MHIRLKASAMEELTNYQQNTKVCLLTWKSINWKLFNGRNRNIERKKNKIADDHFIGRWTTIRFYVKCMSEEQETRMEKQHIHFKVNVKAAPDRPLQHISRIIFDKTHRVCFFWMPFRLAEISNTQNLAFNVVIVIICS